MRLLTSLALLAGLLWGGYWFVGSTALQTQVEQALTGAGERGVTHGAVTVQGFPNRFDVTVADLGIADAETGWVWKTPQAQVFSMTWKPWHVIARLPSGQVFTTPWGDDYTLNLERLQGSLLLHPGLDLKLNQAVVEGEKLVVTGPGGLGATVGKLVLAAGEDATSATALRLGVQMTDLVLSPALQARTGALGGQVPVLHLDARLDLSAPVDRHMGETQPAVMGLHLADLSLTWGSVRAVMTGDLARDGNGQAEGSLKLVLTHWQDLPGGLVALGLMRAADEPLVTRALQSLAVAQGNPDKVEAVVTMQDGQMTMGLFPLGPAPQLP